MNPQAQFCPNEACPARGRVNEGNIGVHSRKDNLYMCHECKKTFAESRGTMFHGLRTEEAIVTQVVTLLGYGCPRQAIVLPSVLMGARSRTGSNERVFIVKMYMVMLSVTASWTYNMCRRTK